MDATFTDRLLASAQRVIQRGERVLTRQRAVVLLLRGAGLDPTAAPPS